MPITHEGQYVEEDFWQPERKPMRAKTYVGLIVVTILLALGLLVYGLFVL